MLSRYAKIRTLSTIVSVVLSGVSGSVYASGFQLFEENGAGVGNFDAGGAAEAADASTAWYNPAGLVMLDHQQLVLAADAIDAGIEFSGNVQNYVLFNTPTGQVPLSGSNQYGTTEGGGISVIPSFHYALPIGDKVVAALSLVVPFGLESNYPQDSVLRYSATDSRIADIDLTPSIGVKITNKFSVGAGLDFQHIAATFDQVVGLGNVGPIAGLPEDTDTLSENDASDWALGWHAGVLYQFTPATRVGLAYHSKTTFDLDGTSEFKGPLASVATGGASDEIKSNNATTEFTLPATTSLSIYHDVNARWAVMGTINYTDWSVFNNIPLQNVAAAEQATAAELFSGSPPFVPTTTLDANVPQNFHNTWRIATGVNYRMTDYWMWRLGFGIDQDPTSDEDRNVRLPDGDRYDVAVGAHYQATKTLGFDAGWTHLFIADGVVNSGQTVGQQFTYVNGTTDNTANIYGLQLTWNI
ncbi:MAG: transporter [Legionellales bacterium]|nr:transporter [Legionellales bacterium]